MRKPRTLKAGDTISIVSPASPILEEKLQRGLAVLEAAGYRTRLGPHVLDSDFYLAGSDADRASDLMNAFLDPESSAVLCSRGGYGCARLMPHLDLDAMARSTKMFIGFSDVTTLHLALNRRGLATFYAPMALTFVTEREPWVYESFLSMLKGDPSIPLHAPKGQMVVRGSATGEVTGGCLCLLCDSLLTPDPLDAAGKILLIEDVDENPHRVDAMFTHLLNAGILQSAAGIVVGEMTGTDDREDSTIGRRPWTEIVAERLQRIDVPSIIKFPFGHARAMLSLPLGLKARLDASAGTLTYLETSCEPA